MRRIVKNVEPREFSEWKKQDTMAHRPRWSRVPGDIKRGIHCSLLQEQGAICCYCESRVTIGNSHVEHFRPKERFRQHQLKYDNLHCSCQRELKEAEPRHCGHSKGSWFNSRLISPLERDCGEHFTFTGSGEIRPRLQGDCAAKITIEKLRLNIPKLRALRAAAIDALRDLTSQEVARLMERGQDGKYMEFHSAVRQILIG